MASREGSTLCCLWLRYLTLRWLFHIRADDPFLASILDLDFVFDVSHGSTFAPHDVGAVAVIDGSMFASASDEQSFVLIRKRNPQVDALEAIGSSSTNGSQRRASGLERRRCRIQQVWHPDSCPHERLLLYLHVVTEDSSCSFSNTRV